MDHKKIEKLRYKQWKQMMKAQRKLGKKIPDTATLEDLLEEFETFHPAQDQGFKTHFFITAGISAFLIFLNLLTNDYPFSIIVTGALSIPLMPHLAHWLTVRKEKEELENIESLEDQGVLILKKFLKTRKSLRVVQYTGFGIVGFLTLLNLILSFTGEMTFPHLMSLIPGAAILTPLAIITLTVKRKLKDLKSRLKPFIKTRKGTRTRKKGEEATLSEMQKEAKTLVKKIMSQLENMGGTEDGIPGEIRSEVAHYVSLFDTVDKQKIKLDQLLVENSPHLLTAEADDLSNRLEGTKNEALQLEYKKAISQINRQLNSLKDLEEQKELLDLKAKNGLNTLKQVNLDLARKDLEHMSVDILKEQAGELDQYLKDLNESYKTL